MQKRLFFVVFLLSGCATQEATKCTPEKVGLVDLAAVVVTSDYGKARMQEYSSEHGAIQLKADGQHLLEALKKMQQEVDQNPSAKQSLLEPYQQLKQEVENHRKKVNVLQEGSRAYAKTFAENSRSVIEASVREVAAEQNLLSVVNERQAVSACAEKVDITELVKKRFDQKMKVN